MRPLLSLLLTAALPILLTACATPANDSESSQLADGPSSAQVAQAAPTGPKIRECRYAKSTGSKMRTRICRPQEEWARIDAATDQGQNTDAFFRTTRENATTGASGGLNAP